MSWPIKRITRKPVSRRDAFTNRTLLRRLALKVARDKDRQAAEVLGDLMMENQLASVQTGRKRKVVFRTELNWKEYDTFWRRHGRRGVEDPAFTLYGQETLSGVPEYAARRTDRAWREIQVSWPVSKKDLYRKLKAMRLLPPGFRLSEFWIERAPDVSRLDEWGNDEDDLEYVIRKNQKSKKVLTRLRRRAMESPLV